ncbi:MAG: 1-acyl-sn-glycerol-3-phosphate acyltransferase [Bacteroidia bacterium]|nr:1-acyl-sn-glycerol-3-phosphate acyltransferase [Bacteroidia bacterium]
MIRALISMFLRLGNWKITGNKPTADKCIIIVLPHTSIFDFVLGKFYATLVGMNPKVLIKKDAFFFPLGAILKALGGIPVDRGTNRHLADQLIEYFRNRKEFILVIAPEGTRKKVKRLKRGFYHIAMETGLPVYMGYINFKTRQLGTGPQLPVTGDFNADMDVLKEFYRGMEGMYPERFDAKSLC